MSLFSLGSVGTLYRHGLWTSHVHLRRGNLCLARWISGLDTRLVKQLPLVSRASKLRRLHWPTRTGQTAEQVTLDYSAALGRIREGDVLSARLPDGKKVWLEVTSAGDSSGFEACTSDGFKVSVGIEASDVFLTQIGPSLSPDAPWLSAYPGWAALLQQHASRSALVPPDTSPVPLYDLQAEASLAGLLADVRRDPTVWRDGTGPSQPPLTELQSLLLTAGEALCLLEGMRGVVMVQLHVGWDDSLPQPVYRPFVIRLLREAAENPHLAVTMSSVPVGDLGLTAILSADQAPWREWAAGLADFGAQAAIVAQSAYYKLLIGRVLGYREDYIHHHIRAGGDEVTPGVRDLVAMELNHLSPAPPLLPWTHFADPHQPPSRSPQPPRLHTGPELGQQQRTPPEAPARAAVGFGATATGTGGSRKNKASGGGGGGKKKNKR